MGRIWENRFGDGFLSLKNFSLRIFVFLRMKVFILLDYNV